MNTIKRLVVVVFLFVAVLCSLAKSENSKGYHPCCSYPCQNHGVCTSRGFSDYECDCTNTGYYGRNCEQGSLWKTIGNFLQPSAVTKHHLLVHNGWLWNLISSWDYLHDKIMRFVYEDRGSNIHSPPTHTSEHPYITLEAAFNRSHYVRSLPPVHTNCPTPMGVAGKKVLPDIEVLAERVFKRTTFKPDPLGHSVHLPSFAQHFTHQFFKTDYKKGPQYQWGGHGLDVTHVYGKDKHDADLLRSFQGGRLKSQILKGEEYPPYLKDAPVKVIYPKDAKEDQKFALGHEFFAYLPNLFVYSTIWLREHNRVVGILAHEHPDWSDEQLYQTGKLVIVGETINIVISDYVQHLSNYNIKLGFKPHVLMGSSYQYQNQIALEFNHLYHWHPMMPSKLHIADNTYEMKNSIFRPDLVVKHGLTEFAASFTKQNAGQMTFRNHGETTLKVAKSIVLEGRQLRLQPYNQYLKRFNLSPYKSFIELTGDQELADTLEELYGDIDAVEFYTGLVSEKRAEKGKFSLSLLEIGASYSVKGLLSNPICSPDYWKPSTFGGQIGLDIIMGATLEKLFCNNIKGDCPKISFKVPAEYVDKQKCGGNTCAKTEL